MILNLPVEIIFEVCLYLDDESLASLAICCKHLNSISEDAKLMFKKKGLLSMIENKKNIQLLKITNRKPLYIDINSDDNFITWNLRQTFSSSDPNEDSYYWPLPNINYKRRCVGILDKFRCWRSIESKDSDLTLKQILEKVYDAGYRHVLNLKIPI